MVFKYIYCIITCAFITLSWATLLGQKDSNTILIDGPDTEGIDFYYSSPVEYSIGEIVFTGTNSYDREILSSSFQLKRGQVISIPGKEVTEAIKRLYQPGLFSSIKVHATRVENGVVDLLVTLKEKPQLSQLKISGVKKSEKDDIKEKSGLSPGMRVNEFMIQRTKEVILAILKEKGFSNSEVEVVVKDDPLKDNFVIFEINVEKNSKTKVRNIEIEGNNLYTDNRVERAMKKTNERHIRNFFKTRKFIEEEFKNDKKLVIDFYNKEGYRDAKIVEDTIVLFQNKRETKDFVNITLNVEEGNRYFFGDIKWVGNTLYPGEFLTQYMGIKKGDPFNSEKLAKRLQQDEDAVSSLYTNVGYLMFNVMPVELSINNDTINYEFRMFEGEQFTINDVNIVGNNVTNEKVIRRELRVKPGELYSQDALIRSIRELSQLQYLDPEFIASNLPKIEPDPQTSTADVTFQVAEKSNDQVSLSGGYGGGLFIFSLGLSFGNFSATSLFDGSAYHPLPSGDGETFSLNASFTGQAYQSVGLSYVKPWFGDKKPNTFSASTSYSQQFRIDNSYYNSLFASNTGGLSYTASDIVSDSYIKIYNVRVGLQQRLSWPDDYFYLYNGVSYSRSDFKNWLYGGLTSGNSNILSINTIWGRNSTDNPIFPRRGSDIQLGLNLTPPYSLFSDPLEQTIEERQLWQEFYQWSFNNKLYTNLGLNDKLVLMTRLDFGFIGEYNQYKPPYLVKYTMGGSGLGSYVQGNYTTVAMRGYEESSLSIFQINQDGEERTVQGGNIYQRFVVELRYALTLSPQASIWVHTFMEAGNAWYDWSNYTPFELRRSAGLGLRFLLPMLGLIGVDWGYGFENIGNLGGAIGGSQFTFIIGREL